MPNEIMCKLGRVSTTMVQSYGQFTHDGAQFHDVGCATQAGNRYGSLNQVRRLNAQSACMQPMSY